MRSSIIETRSEDYVTTARAKGLTDSRVLAPPRLPERDAADGHARRHQPRATSSPGRSRPRSSSTGRVSGRSTVDALAARDYPVLQGVFLLLVDHGRAREPRRGRRVRRPRSAGPDMSAASTPSTPSAVAASLRSQRWRLRSDLRTFCRRFGRRADGRVGLAILRRLHGPGDRPAALRRAARDRHHRDRGRPRAASLRAHRSGPTSSAGTCST